jgi:methylmalonyl-CoA mutase
MTPEFGAASQLEKIDMLDFADFVAINKFDRKGSQDALRDVAKQVQRNREQWDKSTEEMPVFGTQASRFNDDGVTALYQGVLPRLTELGLKTTASKLTAVSVRFSSGRNAIVPPARSRYLAEIADSVRGYHRRVEKNALTARERQQLTEAKRMMQAAGKTIDADELIIQRENSLDAEAKQLLSQWPSVQATYSGEAHVTKVRDREIRTQLDWKTLSGNSIRKVSLPKYADHGDLLRWLMKENLPGYFPYTAGVFPFKRENEDPTRMFAGEGDAFRTNRRFKLVSEGMPAKRLSTAFDSVTLYGADPAIRPDIYGKVGNWFFGCPIM